MRERLPPHETLEVWMRAHTTVDVREYQQEIRDQLSRLEDEGVIAELRVNIWEQYIDPAVDDVSSGPARETLDKVQEFDRWSAHNGTSIPGLQRRTQSSLLTGTTREVFVTPLLCLAVYEDDTLCEIVPYSDTEGALFDHHVSRIVRPDRRVITHTGGTAPRASTAWTVYSPS
jgi:hypothetical protein